MEDSLESADRIGLVLGKKGRENNDRENNNFASMDLHPIILPSIILPVLTPKFGLISIKKARCRSSGL